MNINQSIVVVVGAVVLILIGIGTFYFAEDLNSPMGRTPPGQAVPTDATPRSGS
ncbi:hypothetical protein [Jiella sp. M17.18]|uniref:hypothetical protein n=1 Tax=Jiella sp. M17.18 TaxID=3234247 RepID=UPI0034DE530B